MKFNKGQWMLNDGVEMHNIAQIRELNLSRDAASVNIYAVEYTQDERGLGGPTLDITISSPQKDIIRLQAVHFKGCQKKYPSFEIVDKKEKLKLIEKDDKTIITSGDTSVVITKRPASFTFYYKDKILTSIGKYFGKTLLSYARVNGDPYMRTQLETDIGEKIYGFGEKFTPFVKNGQVVETWNEDGGTASEISYKSVPFYITNRGYGVFVNDTGPVSFEVCSEAVTNVQFSTPGEKLDFMVIGGANMQNVISSYTDLTGKPALVPAWSFGLWLTSSFTTSYDEKTVMSFIDGMAERHIPLSVFHIDCFWMKENEWCGFEWDKSVFPNPSQFIKKIKDKGIKVCVWINPYIGQKSSAFNEASERGYLLKRPNGDIWQGDLWQAGLAIVDFTNPNATAWYKSKLVELLNQGVDAFKTDFGERIPVDCKYFDGSDQERMHNYYSYLYNKVVFETLQEHKGAESCLFARSSTTGGQKFPVHWGGDSNSTFPSMYESLRGGLSLCLSGFGFWSHDIGGFEGNADYRLYKRWLAFGLLSTHSRLHGSNSYRVPWLFGDEAVLVCEKFSKLKNTLMPYIFSNAVYTHKTGVPSMRPMVMEFDDLGAEDCDRQYMFGNSFLVAPIFREDGVVDFYLPKGKWTEFFTQKEVDGEKWQNEKHDYFSLPLYIRENSIIPIGDNENNADYDYIKNLTINIYALSSNAKREVHDSKGNLALSIQALRKGKKVTIELSGDFSNNVKIKMINIANVKSTIGGKAVANGKDTEIIPTNNVITFEV